MYGPVATTASVRAVLEKTANPEPDVTRPVETVISRRPASGMLASLTGTGRSVDMTI